jgi:chromosomal replication initiation ATPase DnaA
VKPSATNHSIGQGGAAAVTENQVEKMIEGLPESTEAKTTRLQIARAVGAAAYHSWFHQATFVTREGGLQLVAPNTFVERYWETNYAWVMREI